MRRSGSSPTPYQNPARAILDEPIRRSPSPQPYPRSTSPAPIPSSPRSSAAVVTPNNPFGISLDRFGNVMDGSHQADVGGSNAYSDRPSSRQQYAYGSQHRHDVDDRARYSASSNHVMNPTQARSRTKSQSDLRSRAKYTEDGRPILFMGK